MLSLKNHFSSEKGKVEASSKKSGSGTSDICNPKWQFYRHLFFLKFKFTLRPTETNLERNFCSKIIRKRSLLQYKQTLGSKQRVE